jgi:hypothetical protein
MVTGLVVALVARVAGAVTAPAPAARVVETRLAAPGAAAETAAREPRLAVHAVEAARGEKRVAAAGEGAGFGPLAFAAAFRCRRGRLLLFERPPDDLVHEGEGHPGVGTEAASTIITIYPSHLLMAVFASDMLLED